MLKKKNIYVFFILLIKKYILHLLTYSMVIKLDHYGIIKFCSLKHLYLKGNISLKI